ncbi:hypothetical protein AALP_AA5G267700 [Arabis alpina]|uniref:Protein-ribulosamine 3-kinase, chloroplastic n=1 Tax=Arabis alpina TaxID=50452 RepID=A0A087GZK6_ARAAL|nr:hypothetical protein AALP_AA5G267700 [Arabis alpina]
MSNEWLCGVCRKSIDGDYGAYSCNKCSDYVVHSRCALAKDVWDGEELEGVPEKDYTIQDVKPFDMISEGVILHFLHDHHLLLEVNILYDEKKLCQACDLPIYEAHMSGISMKSTFSLFYGGTHHKQEKKMAMASLSICFSTRSNLPLYSSTRHRNFVTAMSEDPIREWILTEGKSNQITKISSIGGGCINLASHYQTDRASFFVKTNRSIGPEMFEGEALGLEAMYETRTIRVPKPHKVGALPTGGSYIIMEFIEFGGSRGNQAELGRKLGEMHKAGKSSKGFGFEVANTIGSTPQINTWSSDWIEFYGEKRLGYQLKLARDRYGDSAIYEKGYRLIQNMASLFENVVIEPCLLHGDLWSGNIAYDKNSEPVILDPACYYGHNEADFGMSWCAGFGESFYNAYFKVMPKQPGFEKRRDLYLLYHYLNHYNLFGSGYRSSAMLIIDDYLRLLKA